MFLHTLFTIFQWEKDFWMPNQYVRIRGNLRGRNEWYITGSIISFHKKQWKISCFYFTWRVYQLWASSAKGKRTIFLLQDERDKAHCIILWQFDRFLYTVVDGVVVSGCCLYLFASLGREYCNLYMRRKRDKFGG